MTFDPQSYQSFNKLAVDTALLIKELHASYGTDPHHVPEERCDAMIRELQLANDLPAAVMRPAWEFWRDCSPVKDLIENRKDEFFLDGAKRIRRKEYLRADIGPIWNLLSSEDKDAMWKKCKRAFKLAEKIYKTSPREEQERLQRNWP